MYERCLHSVPLILQQKKMFFLTYIKTRSLFRLNLFFIRKYCKKCFFHLFREIKLLFHTFGWKIDGQHQTSGKIYSNLIFHLLLALCMYFFYYKLYRLEMDNNMKNNERFLNVWPMMEIRPMIIAKILFSIALSFFNENFGNISSVFITTPVTNEHLDIRTNI